MGYSIKPIIRSDYVRQDGRSNIIIYVYLDRKKKRYPTDVYIDPKHWNGSKILAACPRSKELTQVLKDYCFHAEESVLNMLKNNQPLTHENFEKYFLSEKGKTVYTIAAAYDDYISYHTGMLEKSSLDVYRSEKTKILDFAGSNYALEKVDEIFYMKYRKHLMDNKGNTQNTLTKVIKKLKAVINFSVKMGNLKENNLSMVSEKENESHRESLEITELDDLENLLEGKKESKGGKPIILSDKLKNVLIYFLFSCYTSVRFSDIKNIKYSNVDGRFLTFTPVKTKNESRRQISIPLTERAQRIIDIYGNKEIEFTLFPVVSNQKTNEYLKIIMMYADIDRNITFHCARHTFAMRSLNFGLPKEYLQKMLGHSKITTTEIYAKYEKTILLEMADRYLEQKK